MARLITGLHIVLAISTTVWAGELTPTKGT